MVPGEDRPQHVLKAGPPRCAPSIPEVLRESESPLPPIPSMEGRSMPDGHTFQPHSVPFWVLSALHLRRVGGSGERGGGEGYSYDLPRIAARLPFPGSPSSAGPNRCVDAAEACTADARCQQLRNQYVAQCLGRAALGGCPRTRCRRALRHFFARGPPALTHALLFCPCANPACAERRRQTFVPACAFSGPGGEPPSCLEPLDACEQSRICRCCRGAGGSGEGVGLAGRGSAGEGRCARQRGGSGSAGESRWGRRRGGSGVRR